MPLERRFLPAFLARFAHTAAMASRACAKESSRLTGGTSSISARRTGPRWAPGAIAHPGGVREHRRGAARGRGRGRAGRPRGRARRRGRHARGGRAERRSEASEEAAGADASDTLRGWRTRVSFIRSATRSVPDRVDAENAPKARWRTRRTGVNTVQYKLTRDVKRSTPANPRTRGWRLPPAPAFVSGRTAANVRAFPPRRARPAPSPPPPPTPPRRMRPAAATARAATPPSPPEAHTAGAGHLARGGRPPRDRARGASGRTPRQPLARVHRASPPGVEDACRRPARQHARRRARVARVPHAQPSVGARGDEHPRQLKKRSATRSVTKLNPPAAFNASPRAVT